MGCGNFQSTVDNLLPLPSGCFLMGGREGDKFVTDVERPLREVVIGEGVLMGKFPVTAEEFGEEGGQIPVVGVSWEEARVFAERVGKRVGGVGRLPTEAEWEYAARAGREVVEPPELGEANFFYDEEGKKVGPGRLTEVGEFGRNEWGYGDLLGNVCEWVEDDWVASYEGAPCDGSARVAGGERKVVRGGAWDYLPRLLRVSWRDGVAKGVRRDNLGFRVVVETCGLKMG
ncbi:MAG: SUMF1/EgtB/PvdO family nonheme iron enzyme [Verrucomicrobiota bacterium]